MPILINNVTNVCLKSVGVLVVPNKKELIIAEVIEEIAPAKQGFPCCIISRETSEKRLVQKGLKDYEIKYEFKMVKFSKRPELDEYLNQGWEVRKYSDLKNNKNGKNPISAMLNLVAVIVYLAGIIGTIVIGVNYDDFSVVLTGLVITFISGTFYLGLAEIIRLLHDIKRK